MLEHTLEMERQGVDLARRVQENSVAAMGDPSLEAAESAMARAVFQRMGGGACAACEAHVLR